MDPTFFKITGSYWRGFVWWKLQENDTGVSTNATVRLGHLSTVCAIALCVSLTCTGTQMLLIKTAKQLLEAIQTKQKDSLLLPADCGLIQTKCIHSEAKKDVVITPEQSRNWGQLVIRQIKKANRILTTQKRVKSQTEDKVNTSTTLWRWTASVWCLRFKVSTFKTPKISHPITWIDIWDNQKHTSNKAAALNYSTKHNTAWLSSSSSSS